MSLESQVTALTEALRELTKVILELDTPAPVVNQPADSEAQESAPKPKAKAKTKAKAKAKTKAKTEPKLKAVEKTEATTPDPSEEPEETSDVPEADGPSESESESETQAEAEAEEQPPEDAKPTLEQVRDALVKLNDIAGRDKVVELLSSYNAEKLPEVSEADYGDLIADAEQKCRSVA